MGHNDDGGILLDGAGDLFRGQQRRWPLDDENGQSSGGSARKRGKVSLSLLLPQQQRNSSSGGAGSGGVSVKSSGGGGRAITYSAKSTMSAPHAGSAAPLGLGKPPAAPLGLGKPSAALLGLGLPPAASGGDALASLGTLKPAFRGRIPVPWSVRNGPRKRGRVELQHQAATGRLDRAVKELNENHGDTSDVDLTKAVARGAGAFLGIEEDLRTASCNTTSLREMDKKLPPGTAISFPQQGTDLEPEDVARINNTLNRNGTDGAISGFKHGSLGAETRDDGTVVDVAISRALKDRHAQNPDMNRKSVLKQRGYNADLVLGMKIGSLSSCQRCTLRGQFQRATSTSQGEYGCRCSHLCTSGRLQSQGSGYFGE